ncbi:unnamed protein product, partial [Callosobruchus maculatus]
IIIQAFNTYKIIIITRTNSLNSFSEQERLSRILLSSFCPTFFSHSAVKKPPC